MIRVALVGVLLAVACGRSQGVPDQDLGPLVVEPKQPDAPILVAKAASEPAELGRALMQPHRKVLAAIGPHTVAIATKTTVEEAGTVVTDLGDETRLENGDAGSFRAVYTNTADYGREATFVGGRLYLRPRYQRWHGRAPETADEPLELRDAFFAPIAATWDLLAPGVEITDQGATTIDGRAGRKIAIKLSPRPGKPAAEPLTQRRWREQRTIEELTGEVILDADKGVPLSVKLAGTIGFMRDGRRFRMKTALTAAITSIGTAAAITAPPDGEVVATPERLREVDERDYLLQGIAPPIKKKADGTAATPDVKPETKADTKPAAPPAPTDGGDAPKPKKTNKSDDGGDAPTPAPDTPAAEAAP